MKEIISTQNKFFKEIKSLKNKKDRDRQGKFLVEGTKNIQEALKSDYQIDSIIFSKEFISNRENYNILNRIKHSEELNEKCYFTTESNFKLLSDTITPQGILGIIEKSDKILEIQKGGFYLILENISDPGNLGAIIRTADACNINGVVLTKGSVDKYSTKVVRATMGSIFHIDVFEGYDIIDIIKIFKNKKYRIYGGAGNTESYVWNMDLRENIAMIIGNEASGLSDLALKNIDEKVSIPMPGESESLNASMAAGIFIYEHLRQKTT